jgi:hypothetical protein
MYNRFRQLRPHGANCRAAQSVLRLSLDVHGIALSLVYEIVYF